MIGKLYKFFLLSCFSLITFSLSAQDDIITGHITCINGTPLANISVFLGGPGLTPIEVKTDEEGRYKFSQIEDGQTYEVTPSFIAEDPLFGITGDDKNMIHNHIIGISFLSAPFQMLTADIDLSGSITLTDILLLQGAILGIGEDAIVDNWRFATTDFQFPSPSLPNGAGFVDTAIITVGPNMPEVDFIGVKFGDADASACP